MSEIKPVGVKTAEQRIDAFGNFTVTNGSHITVYTDRHKAMLLATKEEVAELRAAYEALQKEKTKIEDELDEYKEHHEELTEHYRALQFLESEFRKENESLNAEVFRLKNELIASLKDWHDLNANNAALQKENDQWKTVLDCNEQIRVALQKENAELKAEDEISAAVIEKCCNILAQIAITINGEQKELTRHSYHDLPELVLVLHVENELNKNRILGQSDEIESLRKQVAELEEKLQYSTNTAC